VQAAGDRHSPSPDAFGEIQDGHPACHSVKPRAVFSLKTGKLETADRKPRNSGTWPQKMQSLSKHGCFAYLENLGSSGPTVAARIDAEWQVSPPPTGTASPR
jgi:hypothetical protein